MIVVATGAHIKDSGVNSAIIACTRILTSPDGKQWICTSGNPGPKCRPASCR